MNTVDGNSLQTTSRIGYWSSLFLTIIIIVHSISYYPVIQSGLVPAEKFDIQSYMAVANKAGILTSGFIPQFSALLLGFFCLILTACVYRYAPKEKKIFALISLCFSVMSCTILSMSEFTQWVSLKRSALAGDFDGLAQYTQGNMNSFVFAMVVLAVHVLLSLSLLFLAPVFTSNKMEKAIAGLLAFSGSLGAVSVIGIATGILPLLFVHDGLGSIGLLIAAILLMGFWKRVEHALEKTV